MSLLFDPLRLRSLLLLSIVLKTFPPLARAADFTLPGPKGVVRVEGHALRDDSGPFLGLGASYFQAMRRAKFDRARFQSDIEFLAGRKFNYVRVLSMVGWFNAWDSLEIAPIDFKNRGGKPVNGWPDYWQQFGDMIDLIHERGMRTQITIFADAQLMPETADRIEHMTRLLKHLKGREHKVILIEVANEAWQNGFPGDDGVRQLRDFAKFLAERTEIPIAITSNHEDGPDGAAALYRGSAADVATWHFSRDTRTPEGGWLPVREPYWAGGLKGMPPFSSNEPIGPGSSVSSENDPIKLVMAAAFAWTAGLPMYVYHSSAGVFGRVPFQEMPAAGDYAALVRILPADLPGWLRNDGKEPSAPLTAFADEEPNEWWPDVKDAVTGVVRNTGAVNRSGSEFVALPIGIRKGGATFQARREMAIRVLHPLNGSVVTNMTLAKNAKFWLPQNDGAYVIRGEFRGK